MKYLLCILKYSGSSKNDYKKSYLIPKDMKRTPLWHSDIILFVNSFTSIREASGEDVVSKYSNKSPPTVS